MTRGVGSYFLFAIVLVALVGCGRNYFFGERETWRRDAEVACLKSGAVKESPVLIRAEPIQGPGRCGADFPFKVAALGMSSAIGYTDEVRPPGSIPGASTPVQPKWPIIEPRYAPPAYEPRAAVAPPRVSIPAAPGAPMSISPPGLEPAGTEIGGYDRSSSMGARPGAPAPNAPPRRRSIFDPPSDSPRNVTSDDEDGASAAARAPLSRSRPPYDRPATIPLGPRPQVTGSVRPVEVKPVAMLACPMVSALDHWIAGAVQPAARRWFGQPVVEIKQISAYSCRGMNGNPRARISEHAFGNALDIAAFILADGHRVTVREGWRGAPEEQGFLHDIQVAACEQFTTVLAPGSNRFHYDHIHVDLMRRASGRVVCEPDAIPGDVVAARARATYARRADPSVTGSIASSRSKAKTPVNGDDEDEMENPDDEPRGGPGED